MKTVLFFCILFALSFAVSFFLSGCGGVVDDPATDSGTADQLADEASADVVDAEVRGHVCMTDPNNGAGFYVDGGCDIGGTCVADDGLVGKCF